MTIPPGAPAPGMKHKGTPMQTAPLDFRLATRADEEQLIALMREF